MDITLTWAAPDPVPAQGYMISYWNKLTPNDITEVAAASSPKTITGLPDGNYAGQIWSICGFKNESPRLNWEVNLSEPSAIVITGSVQANNDEISINVNAPMPCNQDFSVVYGTINGQALATVSITAGDTGGYAQNIGTAAQCIANVNGNSAGNGIIIVDFVCGSQQYELHLSTSQACP